MTYHLARPAGSNDSIVWLSTPRADLDALARAAADAEAVALRTALDRGRASDEYAAAADALAAAEAALAAAEALVDPTVADIAVDAVLRAGGEYVVVRGTGSEAIQVGRGFLGSPRAEHAVGDELSQVTSFGRFYVQDADPATGVDDFEDGALWAAAGPDGESGYLNARVDGEWVSIGIQNSRQGFAPSIGSADLSAITFDGDWRSQFFYDFDKIGMVFFDPNDGGKRMKMEIVTSRAISFYSEGAGVGFFLNFGQNDPNDDAVGGNAGDLYLQSAPGGVGALWVMSLGTWLAAVGGVPNLHAVLVASNDSGNVDIVGQMSVKGRPAGGLTGGRLQVQDGGSGGGMGLLLGGDGSANVGGGPAAMFGGTGDDGGSAGASVVAYGGGASGAPGTIDIYTGGSHGVVDQVLQAVNDPDHGPVARWSDFDVSGLETPTIAQGSGVIVVGSVPKAGWRRVGHLVHVRFDIQLFIGTLGEDGEPIEMTIPNLPEPLIDVPAVGVALVGPVASNTVAIIWDTSPFKLRFRVDSGAYWGTRGGDQLVVGSSVFGSITYEMV